MNMRFPIEEYLTDTPTSLVPEGFTAVEQSLTRGLPHQIKLQDDINLMLIVPSGLANTWRDSEPTLELTCSANERAPYQDPGHPYRVDFDRPPARLMVRNGRKIRAAIPLTAGLQVVVDIHGEGGGALLELHILEWDIRCGSMRDAGDYGTRVRLAWRRIEKAVEKYSTPPVNPYLLPRLKPIFRMHSLLGLKRPKIMARFSTRQAKIKFKVPS